MNDDRREQFTDRVHTLAGLGHRGSGTSLEAKAAGYIARQWAAAGLEPHIQPFDGARSLGQRIGVHVLIALAGALLLWSYPLAGGLVGLAALLSVGLEHTWGVPLLGRFLIGAPSQNVATTVPARTGAPRRRVVLVGHYDTQRTGWIWNEGVLSPVARVLTRAPGPLKSPLFPVMATMLAQPLVARLLVIFPESGWVNGAGIAIVVLHAIATVLLFQWGFGPYVPGAADNASGAAAVMSLAEAWKADPVDDVELVAVCVGCEEVGLLGTQAWIRENRAAMRSTPTWFVNFDTLAHGKVRILGGEYALVGVPAVYDPHVLDLAVGAADDLGLLGAGPHTLPVATDGLAFALRGIPGVTLTSFRDDGHMPNYHQLGDTAENMDFDVAWDGVRLGWGLLRRLAEER
jgi:hypothetical protein